MYLALAYEIKVHSGQLHLAWCHYRTFSYILPYSITELSNAFISCLTLLQNFYITTLLYLASHYSQLSYYNTILPYTITELSATSCLTLLQNCQIHLHLALHYYRTFYIATVSWLMLLQNFYITTVSCLTPLQIFHIPTVS